MTTKPNKEKIDAALEVLATEGTKIYHAESVPDKWACIGAAIYFYNDDTNGVARLAHEFFEQWNFHNFCGVISKHFPRMFDLAYDTESK